MIPSFFSTLHFLSIRTNSRHKAWERKKCNNTHKYAIVRLHNKRAEISGKLFIADDGYTREKQNDKARSKFQRKEGSEKLKQRFSTFFRRKFTCNFLSADKRFVILGEKCVIKLETSKLLLQISVEQYFVAFCNLPFSLLLSINDVSRFRLFIM